MMVLFRFLLFWALPLFAAFAGLYLAAKTKRYADVWAWYWKSTALYLVGLFVTALGLVMVALALPFRIEHPSMDVAYSDLRQEPGMHRFVTLPIWARWWSNEFDGAEGDRRGWWNTYCLKNFNRNALAFFSMWYWLAIRNPANYWSRNITGCNVVGSTVETVLGPDLVDEDNPGFHFLILTDASGKHYPVVELCYPWPFSKSHGIYGRFGWKIKADHAGTAAGALPQDQIKGSVYRCSLWKNLS